MSCCQRHFAAILSLAATVALAASAAAQQAPQNDTDDDNAPKQPPYADLVRADKPVAYWRFEGGRPRGAERPPLEAGRDRRQREARPARPAAGEVPAV